MEFLQTVRQWLRENKSASLRYRANPSLAFHDSEASLITEEATIITNFIGLIGALRPLLLIMFIKKKFSEVP